MKNKPNILFLMSDQHRWDFWGRAGHKVLKTPHLDTLAQEGVLFEGAYTSSPLCMPVRSTIISGEEPHAHGIESHGVGLLGEKLRQECFTWELQKLGYNTGFVGKHHFFNQQHGSDLRDFDGLLETFGFTHTRQCCGKLDSLFTDCHYSEFLKNRGRLQDHRKDYERRRKAPLWDHTPSPLGEDETSDAWVGQETQAMLKKLPQNQPYFLWASFPGPHDPWDAPGKYATLYDPADMVVPENFGVSLEGKPARQLEILRKQRGHELTEENLRGVMAQYCGMISLVDAQIGRILKTLEERGDLENTYIIYTTDHGEVMGDFNLFLKCLFYESSVRIPFIVKGPEVPSNEVCKSLFSSIDFYQTFISLAGGEQVKQKPSRDLSNLFKNPSAPWEDVCFSELGSWKMVRTKRYKLTYDPMPIEKINSGVQELYDLQEDPYERNNLAGSIEYKTIEREHVQLILDHIIQTGRSEFVPTSEIFSNVTK